MITSGRAAATACATASASNTSATTGVTPIVRKASSLGGRPRGAGDFVIGLMQQAGQPPPDHTGCASEKHFHVATLFKMTTDRLDTIATGVAQQRGVIERMIIAQAGRTARAAAIGYLSLIATPGRRATFKTWSQIFRRSVTRQ